MSANDPKQTFAHHFQYASLTRYDAGSTPGAAMLRREFIGRIATFNGALVFVAANALLAAVSYLLIVGEIKRMVLVK
jgi:hypothetical protein